MEPASFSCVVSIFSVLIHQKLLKCFYLNIKHLGTFKDFF